MVLSNKTKEKMFNEHVESLKNHDNHKRINKQIIGGIKKKQKRISNKKINFLDEMVVIANEKWPLKSRNVKYSHLDFLKHLIHFTETHVSWRKYLGLPNSPFSGKYLNSIHLKYINKGIYEAINLHFLNIYLEYHKCAKLKFQSIDSSFIANKQGIYKTDSDDNVITTISKKTYEEKVLPKNPNLIFSNRYNGRKRYVKISNLVDVNGAVLTSLIFSGKSHDCNSVNGTIDNLKIKLNTEKYSKNNKYKQYLLADSGYDTQKIIQLLISKGYTPIIKPNNRNCSKKSENKQSKLLHVLDQDKKIIANVNFVGKYTDESKIIIFRALKKQMKIKNYDKYTIINFSKDTENIPIKIITKKCYTNTEKTKPKPRKFNTKEKMIYKKRQIVENSFAWLKNFPSLNQIYQKTILSHNGLLQLSNSIMLTKKISNERNSIPLKY